MNWTKIKDFFRIDLEKKAVRSFGLILAGILLAITVVKAWKTGEISWTLPSLSVVLGLLALLYPKALWIIYIPWMIIALSIGFLITHLLLGLMFYLILTPIGIIMRIFGRDPLQRVKKEDSYWIARKPGDRSGMERMF